MANTLRIVVLISGNGSNLQALIEQQKVFNYSILAVISNQASAFGLTRAKKAGIPAITLNHKNYYDRIAFDHALINIIDSINADLIVLAGFMRILSPEFTQYYMGKIINIHPSLLPRYKGLHTHKRVLENKDRIHGATVHFVTPALDDGAVIIQAQITVNHHDTKNSLQARVQKLEHTIYPIAVSWIAEGRLYYNHQKAWLDNQPVPVEGFRYCLENTLTDKASL